MEEAADWIPSFFDERGEGWRRMAKSLVACEAKRRSSVQGGGVPFMVVPQQNKRSYIEALGVLEREKQGLGKAFSLLEAKNHQVDGVHNFWTVGYY